MLYIVATPIGNLEDITLRALRILKEVDFILAEDTRKTGILLKHFCIKSKLISFDQYKEKKKTQKVIEELKKGKSIALVSNAGMPSIFDPGFFLIRECIAKAVKFSVIPGPSAVINSLVLSGLPSGKFIFLGFLPKRKGKKKAALKEVAQQKATIIVFESPYRISDTLCQMKDVFGDKEVVLVREMTKMFEEALRANVDKAIIEVKKNPPRGECVLVLNNN